MAHDKDDGDVAVLCLVLVEVIERKIRDRRSDRVSQPFSRAEKIDDQRERRNLAVEISYSFKDQDRLLLLPFDVLKDRRNLEFG